LAIQEKTVGSGHPDVATTLFNYSDLLRKVHRKAEARKLTNRARQIASQNDHERPMQYTIDYRDIPHPVK
jgi:hypothetical protein